jgi:hypothetical protein
MRMHHVAVGRASCAGLVGCSVSKVSTNRKRRCQRARKRSANHSLSPKKGVHEHQHRTVPGHNTTQYSGSIIETVAVPHSTLAAQ